jgi:type IV pilus assembly protein PilA
MSNIQRGFSLIELMIVVAVLGVLASIGFPTFQDYLVRARVAEGLQLAGVAERIVTENAMNATPRLDIGWQPHASATASVHAIKVDPHTGVISVQYNRRAGDIQLWLTPRSASQPLAASREPQGIVEWSCSTEPQHFGKVPATCRNSTS